MKDQMSFVVENKEYDHFYKDITNIFSDTTIFLKQDFYTVHSKWFN